VTNCDDEWNLIINYVKTNFFLSVAISRDEKWALEVLG